MPPDLKTELTIALPLRQLGNERKGIEEKLNELVSQYVPQLDGVLIKWSDLNLISDKGTIMGDQPYVFWKVSISAQIFTPSEGKLVKGKVNQILKYYFIAFALNTFTVTVTIPEDLLEHHVVQSLMVDQDVYFKFKGISEGAHRGEFDTECLDLTAKLQKERAEEFAADPDKDVYEYAKDFEY